MPLLLDTGVVYALADADDAWHGRARELVRRRREVLITPITVVPEVTYLLRARLGAKVERTFVESLAADEMAVEGLTAADFRRCSELLARYEMIGFVDASVVAIAERLKLGTIATTDHRHFAAMRPKHVSRFELVP